MRDFLKESFLTNKVLIIGKGPSLDRLTDVDLNDFTTIAINDAVCVSRPNFLHLTHYEDYPRLAPFFGRAGALVGPYYPISKPPLKDYKFLGDLPKHQFTFGYNLNMYSAPKVGDSPSVSIEGFSIQPIVELLALKGIKFIRTIGVDGGLPRYSESMMKFKDARENIKKNQELENFAGYNAQFNRVKEITSKYGIDFDRLYKVVNA